MQGEDWFRMMNDALRTALLARGIDLTHVDDATDLVQSGLVDSIEFVTLVLELEEATGRALDLEALGDALAEVGALSRALDGSM